MSIPLTVAPVVLIAALMVALVGTSGSANAMQEGTATAKQSSGSSSVQVDPADQTAVSDASEQATSKATASTVKPGQVSSSGAGPWNWIVRLLRTEQTLTIFVVLALGYWIGSIRFGFFSFGSVTGTLLAGLLIGQLDITISSQVKSIFFTMFLFAVGYSVGPQFVTGVARDGLPQAIFAVVIVVICFLSTYLSAKLAGLDVGFAAGMWAGAQTISASIGLANDAINHSGASNASELINQIPVSYAICYIFGTIGTGMILAYLGPTLIKANLAEACKKYEEKLSHGAPEQGMESAWHQLYVRAFEISGQYVGMSIMDFETQHSQERIFVEAVKRDGAVQELSPDLEFQSGDHVLFSGGDVTIASLESEMKEIVDKDLSRVKAETVDLVITNKKAVGRTLVDLAKEPNVRGVFINKITRGATSMEIPLLAQMKLHRGDIVTLSGTEIHTRRMEKEFGYVDRTSQETDMVWVGLFIFIAGALGAITITIGSVPITLSVSGGVLIGGLVLGWLRAVHPTFGRLPEPTQWFMNSVGLNVFIAIVGITAGPSFIDGLLNSGLTIFFLGILSTSVPMLLAPLIGKYIFHFDPALNLGCCGGARTSTASVAMVAEQAQSNIPMLGYTVPYAVSNTLLTLAGMIIVLLY